LQCPRIGHLPCGQVGTVQRPSRRSPQHYINSRAKRVDRTALAHGAAERAVLPAAVLPAAGRALPMAGHVHAGLASVTAGPRALGRGCQHQQGRDGGRVRHRPCTQHAAGQACSTQAHARQPRTARPTAPEHPAGPAAAAAVMTARRGRRRRPPPACMAAPSARGWTNTASSSTRSTAAT